MSHVGMWDVPHVTITDSRIGTHTYSEVHCHTSLYMVPPTTMFNQVELYLRHQSGAPPSLDMFKPVHHDLMKYELLSSWRLAID